MMARAHHESDPATGAGHKQVPTGCAQNESDKKSVSIVMFCTMQTTNCI